MPKTSRKKLEYSKQQNLQDQLWKAVTLLENKQEVKSFLKDILSRTEIIMLSKRLEAVKLITQNLTYEQIRRELNMSDATISRIHNQFEAFGEGYRIIIERINSLDKSGATYKKRIVPGIARAAQDVWIKTPGEILKVYKKYKKRKSVN